MTPNSRTAPTFAGCRIEAELGRGGMGVVYRATQLRLERPVALKVMSPELARDERFRQRFERESRLAASIDHPHVIPIYEADEERERLYLVMRYVPGPDLGQLIRREGRLTPARAARITAQVASALDAAHGNGLIHRDIKPANVLIASEGQSEHAYLSDFGLTKRLSSETGITRTGVFLGTVDYVAPEQLRGERIDARADTYSLAGLLFHALTGEVPFPRDDDMAKMFAHGQSEPPKPSTLVPGLGTQFDRVIARGMAKDPTERYLSAGDLGRAALAAAQGGQSTQPERSVAAGAAAPVALPPPPGPPAPRQSRPERRGPPERGTVATRVVHGRRSRRLPLALAAAVLLALGVGGGVLAAALSGGEEPKTEPTGAQQGSGEGAQDGGSEETASEEQTPAAPPPPPVATPRPLTEESPLTTEGLGPVLVGMDLETAAREAEATMIPLDSGTEGCSFVRPSTLGTGVSFMVVDDEIARADVDTSAVATQSGIRVGSAEDDVYEAYGDQIEETENIYEAENPHLMFVPKDTSDNTRIIFETSEGIVDRIIAGRQPEVEYPEGCS